MVGARSAVFAPLPRVGLICVDEEHDAAYKQESDPRYDARTVAAKRATLEGAVAIYGSATPRPESWLALERLDLGERVGAELPPVRIVDLRGEAGYPLSAPLLAELGKLAENGGKAILLLNRRGRGARAALPSLRRDAPLPELRRRARPAPGRAPPLPPLRVRRADARRSARSAARSSSPASAPGRSGSSASWKSGFPSFERFRLDADAVAERGALDATPCGVSPPPIARCSSARRSSPRGITSRAFRSPR